MQVWIKDQSSASALTQVLIRLSPSFHRTRLGSGWTQLQKFTDKWIRVHQKLQLRSAGSAPLGDLGDLGDLVLE